MPVDRLFLFVDVRLEQELLSHSCVSVATGYLDRDDGRDLSVQNGLLNVGKRVVDVVAGVVGAERGLAKETEDEVSVALHGGVDEQQHGPRIGFLLLHRLPQCLLDLVGPLHDQFSDVVMVVVTDGGSEGRVETMRLELVSVEAEELREPVAIGFDFLDYFYTQGEDKEVKV